MLNKLKRNQKDNQYFFDLKVNFPSFEELVAHAEKMTDSCIHPDQVLVGRNFVMDLARRGVLRKKYKEEELNTIGILIDHMAQKRTRSIYSLERNPVVH